MQGRLSATLRMVRGRSQGEHCHGFNQLAHRFSENSDRPLCDGVTDINSMSRGSKMLTNAFFELNTDCHWTWKYDILPTGIGRKVHVFRRLLMFCLTVLVVSNCVHPAWGGGKDTSNLSLEEKAVLEALIFNLIRQRQQQPPPPPPPPPPPDKGGGGEPKGPDGPGEQGPQGPVDGPDGPGP